MAFGAALATFGAFDGREGGAGCGGFCEFPSCWPASVSKRGRREVGGLVAGGGILGEDKGDDGGASSSSLSMACWLLLEILERSAGGLPMMENCKFATEFVLIPDIALMKSRAERTRTRSVLYRAQA